VALIVDLRCPRCATEMEQIETDVENLPFDDLQLCPTCFLVTWTDQDGSHSQQGIPLPKSLRSSPKKAESWSENGPLM
jgi:hypothetical protein